MVCSFSQQLIYYFFFHTVAIDVLAEENALLELKIAAIKHLNYEDYLTVLGETEGQR